MRNRSVSRVKATHNLDVLVILSALIGLEVVLELVGVVRNHAALRRVEVRLHAVVVREDGRRRTNLSTHVADGGHARARERVDAGALVLDNGTSSTLDREDTGDLEDDVCNDVSTEAYSQRRTHPWASSSHQSCP